MPDDELKEIRISGEKVFEGRIVRLEVDRVALPDGVQTVREVIRHPGAVAVVPLLEGSRVVLVRQYRYAHLYDYRTTVKFLSHEVYTGAVLADALLQPLEGPALPGDAVLPLA